MENMNNNINTNINNEEETIMENNNMVLVWHHDKKEALAPELADKDARRLYNVVVYEKDETCFDGEYVVNSFVLEGDYWDMVSYWHLNQYTEECDKQQGLDIYAVMNIPEFTRDTVFTAKWTGEFPCLCHGEWKLYADGIDVSGIIPYYNRNYHMSTYGEYSRCNTYDEWEKYTDGLEFDQWMKDYNKDWTRYISNDPEVLRHLYEALQKEDWRYCSCGGCV